MEKRILNQAVFQATIILLLSACIGLIANHIRPDGIPLKRDWSAESMPGSKEADLFISLEKAEYLFRQNAALFVDARPKDLYSEGHISGAINLPFQAADEYFPQKVETLQNASMIITYCDGESCDLSRELAILLKDMGFDKVKILSNGFSLWKEAGLPVEKEMSKADR